ncbi:SDR family NAD(P)-dependent oxidoreductase [Maribellus sp. CM-23]|uniref:SDR family oxidoreductase n=1 Tax=Maribellus sp. CM-23 TaxID=2781026 RepID=UPI001F274758|nr:SDR family NAD(P)-dependent oxidoreductase [Maribellus sp. CM-23]MCE4566603.1 SDR family NAD(P)-dependent oxidoreductase [Maribellus sp. CM-23]
MDKLLGKNILVTGATSGIGKALVEKLFERGANVAFCGRSEFKLNKLISEIAGIDKGYFEAFDISNESKIISFVASVYEKLGTIDILVNCAGANTAKANVADIQTSDLEWMIKVNMVAPFIFMKEVYQRVQNQESALFINILSTVCNFSNEGIGAYTASKAGFDALLKVFRKEVRQKNVRVCSIYPGGVNTPFRNADKPAYLSPQSVADAIISMMQYDDNTSIDELVIRPLIEKNYW